MVSLTSLPLSRFSQSRVGKLFARRLQRVQLIGDALIGNREGSPRPPSELCVQDRRADRRGAFPISIGDPNIQIANQNRKIVPCLRFDLRNSIF